MLAGVVVGTFRGAACGRSVLAASRGSAAVPALTAVAAASMAGTESSAE